MRTSPVRVLPDVAAALARRAAVVSLESSVFAQGLPAPANRRAAERMMSAIRERRAVPAITAVIRGMPVLGLTAEETERLLARDSFHKVTARDLPWAAVRALDGATTVAASLAITSATGCRVFATGGIGGVHRGAAFDESADLLELTRSPVVVVCAGAKAILDLPATAERLETLGVPVIGYRTTQLPGFFTAETGIAVAACARTAAEVARAWAAHQSLGRSGAILVVQPPPAEAALPRDVVDGAVEHALARASAEGVQGPALTPFLLSAVEQKTGGRSLASNVALLEANAALAAEIALEIAELKERGSDAG